MARLKETAAHAAGSYGSLRLMIRSISAFMCFASASPGLGATLIPPTSVWVEPSTNRLSSLNSFAGWVSLNELATTIGTELAGNPRIAVAVV
jgi:hypothetical protein